MSLLQYDTDTWILVWYTDSKRIQIYDIRIPTDSKQWYTDSNWYDTWYTDSQTVSPMICDTPIHGRYHLRISIPKILGYSVIHKQYPWYSDTRMTHWPPGLAIGINMYSIEREKQWLNNWPWEVSMTQPCLLPLSSLPPPPPTEIVGVSITTFKEDI